MTIIDAWTQLAASQCKAPKDGTFEEKPLVDIIAVIISPHYRAYTGLCFPNAWDPTRPLKLENNDEVRLNNLYDTPVACDCNYEIPLLKHLPKAKKDKTADNKNTRNKDKYKDATKTKSKSSSAKPADTGSKSKHSKPKKDKTANKNETGEPSDQNIEKPGSSIDNDVDMLFSEDSANVQHKSVEPANKTTGDIPVTDKNKTPGDNIVTENKTPGDDSVTTETPSSEDLNSDTDSVVTATDQSEIEMSEETTKMVEYEPPLHTFSAEEDKELLGKCWMTNLSPTWTSSAHIPLPNSKELLLLHYLCRGYDSGFWPEGVPTGLWVPQVYKQLSRSEVFDMKKRIVGELACARALKRTPKTHKFYVEKETAHRAAQESRESCL